MNSSIARNEMSDASDKLKSLIARIDKMLSIADRGFLRGGPTDLLLRESLAALKSEIRESAREINLDRPVATSTADLCYALAISEASARFTLRANAKPATPAWKAGLATVRGEISYQLHRLERDFSGSARPLK